MGMRRYRSLLRSIWRNDGKGIKQAIWRANLPLQEERLVQYMTIRDQNRNHALLQQIQNTLEQMYRSVYDNTVQKQKAADLLSANLQCSRTVDSISQYPPRSVLDQFYREASSYYFQIQLESRTNVQLALRQALAYRLASQCLQHELNQALIHIREDELLIQMDTNLVTFLFLYCKRLASSDDAVKGCRTLLERSMEANLLQADSFQHSYFETVRKVNDMVDTYFHGGTGMYKLETSVSFDPSVVLEGIVRLCQTKQWSRIELAKLETELHQFHAWISAQQLENQQSREQIIQSIEAIQPYLKQFLDAVLQEPERAYAYQNIIEVLLESHTKLLSTLSEIRLRRE